MSISLIASTGKTLKLAKEEEFMPTTVVWLETIGGNTEIALYPTTKGFLQIGYAISLENGKWAVVSFKNPQIASPIICETKKEAADYLINQAKLQE